MTDGGKVEQGAEPQTGMLSPDQAEVQRAGE